MSLFGTSPPEQPADPSMHSSFARSRHGLFDDDGGNMRANSDHLFDTDDDEGAGHANGNNNNNSRSNGHDDDDGGSPWDMPSPRKKKTRAELLRSLLPAADVPESYMDAFDAAVSEDAGGNGKTVSAGGVARALAAAKLDADSQAAVMNVISPSEGSGAGEALALGRNEFNVLLALIGLAQEGEVVSLDGVDERRRSELPHLFFSSAVFLFCFGDLFSFAHRFSSSRLDTVDWPTFPSCHPSPPSPIHPPAPLPNI